jgi:hypothetical protein
MAAIFQHNNKAAWKVNIDPFPPGQAAAVAEIPCRTADMATFISPLTATSFLFFQFLHPALQSTFHEMYYYRQL